MEIRYNTDSTYVQDIYIRIIYYELHFRTIILSHSMNPDWKCESSAETWIPKVCTKWSISFSKSSIFSTKYGDRKKFSCKTVGNWWIWKTVFEPSSWDSQVAGALNFSHFLKNIYYFCTWCTLELSSSIYYVTKTKLDLRWHWRLIVLCTPCF